MPESLHAELARASQTDGVSLNAFITDVLASAVGWQGSGPRTRRKARRAAAAGTGADASKRRLLPGLLVANLLVVAAVGVVALVLLIQAL